MNRRFIRIVTNESVRQILDDDVPVQREAGM